MDKARFLVETHLRTGRPLAELAAARGVHRFWLYKLLARYRREGDAGLQPRSRRPHHSPSAIRGRYENDVVAVRKELHDLGVDAGPATIHAHLARRRPDVCSISTIWRILNAQDPITTRKQLQVVLDHFTTYYNTVRSHRALARRTPADAYTAGLKAIPTGPMINVASYRVRHDKVSKAGNVTIRYRSRLHHIGLGNAYAGWRIVLLVAGRDIRVVTLDGQLLRHLTLNPTVDYQPMA